MQQQTDNVAATAPQVSPRRGAYTQTTTLPEEPEATPRSANAALHGDSFAEGLDSDPAEAEQDGVWSIAPPTGNTPQPPAPTYDPEAPNPFANRTAAEILGFMPTAETLTMNTAAETAINSDVPTPRRHTALYEEANRPLVKRPSPP
jgi:hypothetical protein